MKFKDLVLSNNYLTDKFSSHNYLDLYDELFSPIQQSVKNVLEIGVQKGHSLLLWRDFFVNAQIYGTDITDKKLNINLDLEDRIHYTVGNAYDKSMINKYNNIKFDVIIDDGSHLIEHMTWFVENYPKLLNDDGILIVEDIAHRPHADKLKKILPKHLQSRADVVDLRHIANRWDDVLLVVK